MVAISAISAIDGSAHHVSLKLSISANVFFLKAQVSRDVWYLEITELLRQQWMDTPQLKVGLLNEGPPLHYHIFQSILNFSPLHLNSVSNDAFLARVCNKDES